MDEQGFRDRPEVGVTPDGAEAPEDRWRELLEKLEENSESISNHTVDKILATVQGYGNCPREAVLAAARRNLSMSVRSIQLGGDPLMEDFPRAEELAEERIGQAVPLGSLLSGFRLSMREIQRNLVKLAPEYGTPPEKMLEWSTLLWSLGDVFATQVTAVYRDREIARGVEDSTRKSKWIGRVITGEAETAELLSGAALYDVPSETPVRILAATVGADSGASTEETLHRWVEQAGARVLTTVQSNAIVGILVGDIDPDAPDPGMTVSVGEPELLARLHSTFTMASRVLRTADDLGIDGLVDEEALSWRLAIQASPETTTLLERRYLDPLNDSGPFAQDLLRSVQAYLDHKLNIPAAARSIPVHVNTLRYRLRRFEELTCTDLEDVNTLVEVSWVMAVRGRR